MNPEKIFKREIQLKGQALKPINELTLAELKDFLEAQVEEKFDPALSKKLDCMNFLLEN